MFLAAVARPRYGTRSDGKKMVTFNGKLGCWRVAETTTASRSSKNHARGEEYEKDCTMTSEFYYTLMTTKVMPTISAKFASLGVPKVVVQHDGASPHTGKGTEDKLNEFGATLSPPIEIVRQPSQSPDLNLCDLSFFRALACSVAKRRRGVDRAKLQFDIEKLADDVAAAYAAYSAEKIDHMWAYKSVILQKIITAKGGNIYD